MPHCHTLLQTLRRRGYRITPQREMVIEALAHGDHHMTAEEVLESTRHRSRSLNLATVYRTLDLLVEEGLASQINLGHGQAVYATVCHGPHIHLVCRRCGQVLEVESDLLGVVCEQIGQEVGFACDAEHVALAGLCQCCSATVVSGEREVSPEQAVQQRTVSSAQGGK